MSSSSVRWNKSTTNLKRPASHHPRCRCLHCAPRLDFEGKREAEKTEVERLRAEVATLRAELDHIKADRKAEKAAEREAARADLARLEAETAARLEADRQKRQRAANDPRVKRLLTLRAKGKSLGAALNEIDGDDDHEKDRL